MQEGATNSMGHTDGYPGRLSRLHFETPSEIPGFPFIYLMKLVSESHNHIKYPRNYVVGSLAVCPGEPKVLGEKVFMHLYRQ